MIIHQYTSIDSLALILKNKTIRFKRLDKMDDIEEAALSNAGIHLGGFMFVSCWTFNEIESIPLWRMYTPTTKGVRISLDKNMFKSISLLKKILRNIIYRLMRKVFINHPSSKDVYSSIYYT